MKSESPRQTLAREQLAKAYADYANAMAVHYSCGSLDAQADRPIYHIVVKRLCDGMVYAFCADGESEAAGLARFTDYIDQHPNAKWVNWNFRDSKFGPEHIAARQRHLGLPVAAIPECRRVDLSRLLWNIHGDGYIGNPKLEKLAIKNDVNVRDLLKFDATKTATPAALLASTLRKVEMIEALFILAAEGKLKTALTPAPAIDPFEPAKWFEEHTQGVTAESLRQAAKRGRVRSKQIRKGLKSYSVDDAIAYWSLPIPTA